MLTADGNAISSRTGRYRTSARAEHAGCTKGDDADVIAGRVTDMPDDHDETMARMRAELQETNRRINEQPQVFTDVKDRDLITLMDRFAGPLEFNSMLVAAQLMREVGRRQLWDAVVDRRTAMMQWANPDEDVEALRQQAQSSIDHFRNEHFPVDPDIFDEDGSKAEQGWNGYVQP